MFNDKRSRKIILVAHCIINQNSISDGTADFPCRFSEILELLENNNIGLIQLPCPELMCLGLDRNDTSGSSRELLVENSRIRTLMENSINKNKIAEMVKSVVYQIGEYRKHGFEIIGIIGINRSPSCGIDTTSINSKEATGRGVFMEALLNELALRGININSVGVKTSQIEKSVESTKQLIGI